LMARTKTDLDELQDLATPEDVKLSRLLRQQDTLDYSVRMVEHQGNVAKSDIAAPSSFLEERVVPQDFVDSMKRMSLMSSSAMRDISLFGDHRPHFSFLDKGAAKQFDPDADLKRLENEREEYVRSRPWHMAAPSSLVEEGIPDSFAGISAKLHEITEKTKGRLEKLQSGTVIPSSLLQMSENADRAAKRNVLMDLAADAIKQVQNLKSKLHGSEMGQFDLAGITAKLESKVAERARAGVHAIQNELVTGRTNFLKTVAPMLQTSLDSTKSDPAAASSFVEVHEDKVAPSSLMQAREKMGVLAAANFMDLGTKLKELTQKTEAQFGKLDDYVQNGLAGDKSESFLQQRDTILPDKNEDWTKLEHLLADKSSFLQQKSTSEVHASQKRATAAKPKPTFAEYERQLKSLQQDELGNIRKLQAERANQTIAEAEFERKQRMEGAEASRPSASLLEVDDTPSLLQSLAGMHQTSGAEKLESKYMSAFQHGYVSELEKDMHSPEKHMRSTD